MQCDAAEQIRQARNLRHGHNGQDDGSDRHMSNHDCAHTKCLVRTSFDQSIPCSMQNTSAYDCDKYQTGQNFTFQLVAVKSDI